MLDTEEFSKFDEGNKVSCKLELDAEMFCKLGGMM